MNHPSANWTIVDLNNRHPESDRPNFFAVCVSAVTSSLEPDDRRYYIPAYCGTCECDTMREHSRDGGRECERCGSEDVTTDYSNVRHKADLVRSIASAMFRSPFEIDDMYDRAMLRARAELVMA